jgi:3-hydroxyisobutyrate dehydrogenase-like beta-hydroxyacid dehydrogenase
MNLGFVGLGAMGAPIAGNLLRAGYAVTAHNRTRGRAERLREQGAVVAEPAAALIVKLAGNFLIVSVLETLGEAYALLRKSGLEPAQFVDIVNGALLQSPIYENYGRLIAAERYEPAGFRLRLGLKDVDLALEAAARDEPGGDPGRRQVAGGWSSTCRIRCASMSGAKGFWRKCRPGSSTPCCTMASSV